MGTITRARATKRQPAAHDPFDVSNVASPQAEKALIAYLLPVFASKQSQEDLVAAREVIGRIGREMFTVREAGDAFAAIVEALAADPPTYKDVCDAVVRQAQAGGYSHKETQAFIADVLDNASSFAAAKRHAASAADEVQERYAVRRFIRSQADANLAVRDAGLTAEIVAREIEQLAEVEAVVQRRSGDQRRLVLKPFSEIEAKPVSWLWPKRIMGGGLTIVTGPVGNTKSLFTIDVAAKVTNGWPWPDGTGSAVGGSVIMFGAEDNAGEVIKPRLQAAGANMAKVFSCEGTVANRHADEPAALVLERDIGRLREALEAMDDCRLIVFDPLSDYIAADENSSAEVRAALMPLVRLAQDKNVAVLAVLHQNKKNDLTAVQRIAGSSAFSQVARCVLSIGDHPEDSADDQMRLRRVMLVSKTNNGQRDVGQAYRLIPRDGEQVALEWIDGIVTMSADTLIRKPSGGRQFEERRGDAVDALREALEAGKRPSLEVIQALEDAGFRRRQIDAAAKTLDVVKRRIADDAGRLAWFWWLPAGESLVEIEGTAKPYSEFAEFQPRENDWSAF